MSKQHPSRLRFNFGFLIEAGLGTSRTITLDYPTIKVASDVTLTPLQGDFTATRTSEGVYLSGQLHSIIDLQCVRCLLDAPTPITIAINDLFYYPSYSAPAGENVIGDDGFIDLAPLVRELTLLEMPTKPLCKQNCQGLCIECGYNLNESDCGCRDEVNDPRLAILRDLLKTD